MKNKIQEKLEKNLKVEERCAGMEFEYCIGGLEKSASEIADMVKAFVEWVIFPDRDITTSYRNHRLVFRDKDDMEYTLDELFNYWFNNIREK